MEDLVPSDHLLRLIEASIDWNFIYELVEDKYSREIGMKEIYALRKETVKRVFANAKENHGFRYTNTKGKARIQMKVGLTFTWMNLKKLAKFIQKIHGLKRPFSIKFNYKYKVCVYGVQN